LGLSRGLLFEDFSYTTTCQNFVFSMHKIRPAPSIILHVATQMMSAEEFSTAAGV
jgi:hypothetical protein